MPRQKETYQVGIANYLWDIRYGALRPGRRVSKKGRIYYEYRKNRSDINTKRRL
jgi:hypothetical protein